jgi:hypothetical protein
VFFFHPFTPKSIQKTSVAPKVMKTSPHQQASQDAGGTSCVSPQSILTLRRCHTPRLRALPQHCPFPCFGASHKPWLVSSVFLTHWL